LCERASGRNVRPVGACAGGGPGVGVPREVVRKDQFVSPVSRPDTWPASRIGPNTLACGFPRPRFGPSTSPSSLRSRGSIHGGKPRGTRATGAFTVPTMRVRGRCRGGQDPATAEPTIRRETAAWAHVRAISCPGRDRKRGPGRRQVRRAARLTQFNRWAALSLLQAQRRKRAAGLREAPRERRRPSERLADGGTRWRAVLAGCTLSPANCLELCVLYR